MEFTIQHFGDVIYGQKDFGMNLFANDGVTVQAYHLRKHSSLMEQIDKNTVLTNGNHTVTYLMVTGSMEIRMKNERFEIGIGDSIQIDMDKEYSVWALEDCSFFAVHNCVEPNIDTTPRELVDAVKRVELADTYLLGHNYRVGKYSTLIMQTIAPNRSTANFHLMAAYHDVGKVAVPSEILNKQGKLTSEEFAEIQKHPIASYEMLKRFVGETVAGYARWHHEKLDGSGYPDGLKGDEIPLESRVIAVADIFDALTTSRVYRDAFSFEKALSIMSEDVKAGKLDTAVFACLESMVESGAFQDGIDNRVVLEK